MFTEAISCWLITLLFFQYLIYRDGCILHTEVTGVTTESQSLLYPQLSLYPSCPSGQLKGSKLCPPWIATDSARWKCGRVHGLTTFFFFCEISYSWKQHVHKHGNDMASEKSFIHSTKTGQWKTEIVLHPIPSSPLPFSHKHHVVNNKGKEGSRREVGLCFGTL